MERVDGRLLVATPDLRDPSFARTVVFMVEHGGDGALGVVLNRPTDVDAEQVLPAWGTRMATPRVVFAGGPVQPDGVLALGRRAGDATCTALDLDPGAPGPDVEIVRLFAGYAGWGAGQLEAEMRAGGWFTFDAAPDDPFTTDPDRLWRDVLVRQGGRVALLASCPLDPSLN